MSDYTPSTEQVREAYTSDYPEQTGPEFDRWLDEVKREAAERGWDEGRESVAVDMATPLDENYHRRVTLNPYRVADQNRGE